MNNYIDDIKRGLLQVKVKYEAIEDDSERNEKLQAWRWVYNAYDKTPDIMRKLS